MHRLLSSLTEHKRKVLQKEICKMLATPVTSNHWNLELCLYPNRMGRSSFVWVSTGWIHIKSLTDIQSNTLMNFKKVGLGLLWFSTRLNQEQIPCPSSPRKNTSFIILFGLCQLWSAVYLSVAYNTDFVPPLIIFFGLIILFGNEWHMQCLWPSLESVR